MATTTERLMAQIQAMTPEQARQLETLYAGAGMQDDGTGVYREALTIMDAAETADPDAVTHRQRAQEVTPHPGVLLRVAVDDAIRAAIHRERLTPAQRLAVVGPWQSVMGEVWPGGPSAQ